MKEIVEAISEIAENLNEINYTLSKILETIESKSAPDEIDSLEIPSPYGCIITFKDGRVWKYARTN